MKRTILNFVAIALGLTIALPAALAQDPAAERARLADQRIQAEAERRAEEERTRETERQATATETSMMRTPASKMSAAAGAEVRPQTQTVAADDERPAVTAGNASGAELSLALEQLRTLGELKDAGHVTEEEFERIKRRILEGSF